jgi:hypothetical protein
VFLADKFIQCARTHPVGKGSRALALLVRK